MSDLKNRCIENEMPEEKKSKTPPAKVEERTLFSNKEYASILAELKKIVQECQLHGLKTI